MKKNLSGLPLEIKYCNLCNLSNQQPTTTNEYFHTKDIFLKNIADYNITIHDCDLFYTEKNKIKDIDLFFYDGPHDLNLTARAISYYYNCFADTAILVFDDANWNGVVQGADLGISMNKLKVLYSKKILNTAENKGMWWNGLYIVVVQK